MDSFAYGVNEPMAGHEVFADAVGDVVIFPGVVGEEGESKGHGEHSTENQPPGARTGTRSKLKSL